MSVPDDDRDTTTLPSSTAGTESGAGQTIVDPTTTPTTAGAAHRRPTRDDRRWSGLPIAASLSLVAFAIIFGIYGPRVVDRGSPSVGTPLWEVVDRVVEHFDAFIAHASINDASVIDQESASSILNGLLRTGQIDTDGRVPLICPDLTPIDFAPLEPQTLMLPGATRSAAIVFARASKEGMEYLILAIAPYAEQYTLFSDFGRPQLLEPGGAIAVDAAATERVHASALTWTDGAFLYVAVGSRRTTLLDASPSLVPAMSGVPSASR
jgi:hypothetical protein